MKLAKCEKVIKAVHLLLHDENLGHAMKKIPLLILLLLSGQLLGGCAALVEGEMQQRNEQDLKHGRITPDEFQQNRDEIDRTFR